MKQRIYFCTSVDGTKIAYALSGEGPPLMMTSTFISHLQYQERAIGWTSWLESLSREYTLVRYDPRGCGMSDRNALDLSFESWLADFEAVVQAAGLRRFPILGVCWGGPIAIAYAARHPESVSDLVLYGTFMRGRFKRTGVPNEVEKGRVLMDLTRLGWGQENHAFLEVWGRAFQPGGTLEHLRSWCELQRIGSSPETAVALLNITANLDVRDMAARVRCPTLVMHADRDGISPLEEGRLMAAHIPGARFVQLESANHWLLEDEPAWLRFLSEVRAFLRPGSAARHHKDVRGLLASLSEREREVLEGIAQGLSNSDIAAHLSLSEKTVRNHVTRIFDKLDVDARPSAIVLARKAGFGEAPSLSRH